MSQCRPEWFCAAGLLEAAAEREVHRSADLLVEEDVAREPVDLVVEPERDLAEHARALVDVEQRSEVVLARRASAWTTRPPSKRSRTSSTSRPWKIAGNGKRISPSVSVSTGLVKTSPSGMLSLPSAASHCPALDADAQVGVRPDDPQLANASKLTRPRVSSAEVDSQCAIGSSSPSTWHAP